MLRQEVGTATFWAGIREYYGRYRNGHASTADLRAVFEQASGKQLDWFFTQWLNRGGVPKIAGAWHYDASRRVAEVTLTQSQPGPSFRVKVDVGLVANAGDIPSVQTIEMTAKQGTFTFPLDAAPAAVVLDPNTALLMEPGPFVRR